MKLFFPFFILIYFSSYSQKKIKLEYKKTHLEVILKELEESYDIKFSFNPKIVKNKKISISDNGNLNNILQKIQNQTSLIIEKINYRYYVIRNKSIEHTISICGYLYDDHTKKPLSEAFIFNDDRSKTITSNPRGYFHLSSVKPNDTISIHFLGYDDKHFIAKELENQSCEKIYLSQNDFKLSEVLITEYITSGFSKGQVNGAINIEPSKLGILPQLVEPDVLQSLQFLPGIQSPTETAAGLHIRGGTPDHNLILWDGIKMYNTGHFFDLLSIFNPHITDDIKLFKSNTEAKYGGRISGVIDIKSKDEIPVDSHAGIGFNMTNGDAYIQVPISKDFGLIISRRRSFTDVFQTSTFQSYSQRAFQHINVFMDDQKEQLDQEAIEDSNVFFFKDFTVKAIANISETAKFTASNILTSNKLDYDFNLINIGGFNELFNTKQKDDLKFVNKGTSASWNKKWSNTFSQTIQGYFSSYDFDYSGRRESNFSSDGVIFFENDIIEKNEIRDVGASVHFDWKINPKSNFISGYNFSTNNVSYKAHYSFTNRTYNETGHNITHAIYGDYKFLFGKRTRINIGLRGNYFSIVDKVYWEPRMNVAYTLFNNFEIKISGEHKSQVTSQIENFLPSDFMLDNQIWLLADSQFVSMLKSGQTSIGFVFNKNGWHIDIESYYKKVVGLTSYANGFNGTQDLTEGESETVGVDLLIKKKINNYRTWIGYSFTDQNFNFRETNNEKSFPGNFDITHHLSWVHSYLWRNFEFSLGWNIRTGRPYTPAIGILEIEPNLFTFDFEDINSARLDTYHRLDFSASYKFSLFKKENWISKISFSLFNLYSHENTLNRVYSILPDNSNRNGTFFLQETNTLSSTITPNLSFRIDF